MVMVFDSKIVRHNGLFLWTVPKLILAVHSLGGMDIF